eukprot:13075188-Heterocapsa_arctica.AAC.1
MSTTIFQELNVRGGDAVRIACYRVAQACNSLVSVHGFSPVQWVLDSGRRLPASLSNPDNGPAVVSR